MKNIILFNSNLAWGGGEKWHFQMALALQEKGHQTMLITNSHSELAKAAQKHKIKHLSLNIGNLSFLNPFKVINLFFILKKLKPDAIFLNLPSDVKLCAPIAKFAGVKKIIYRRGMPNPIRKSLINSYVYSKVDTIIANSLEIKRSVCKNLTNLENKIQIIYNGVTPRENHAGPIHTPIRLGNLGRLVEQKGQKHLISIAKNLKEKNIPFTLSIAGVGPLKQELEREIKENNLHNEIRLLGHVDPPEFFHDIDLLLFTSHFEGSANALIESLQFSIPTIAFDTSSNPEVLENGVTGFLIEPYDEVEFANRIIEIKNQPDLYQKLKHNCDKIIREKFNYPDKVNQVEAILLET